jgi:hypothetical protein
MEGSGRGGKHVNLDWDKKGRKKKNGLNECGVKTGRRTAHVSHWRPHLRARGYQIRRPYIVDDFTGMVRVDDQSVEREISQVSHGQDEEILHLHNQ